MEEPSISKNQWFSRFGLLLGEVTRVGASGSSDAHACIEA